MTLEEIEEQLPNGLHDAQISRFTVDYERSSLLMTVKILVGLPAQTRAERDEYRDGHLTFHKLKFFCSELPQLESAFQQSGGLWFSYERTTPDHLTRGLRSVMPAETQCYSLFVQDWFSSIHIAALDVTFDWIATDLGVETGTGLPDEMSTGATPSSSAAPVEANSE